jgi:hypothetical protein
MLLVTENNNMTDKEIAILWTQHYPHRKYDPWARVICDLIRVIVKERAADGNLERTLSALKITKEQWND